MLSLQEEPCVVVADVEMKHNDSDNFRYVAIEIGQILRGVDKSQLAHVYFIGN